MTKQDYYEALRSELRENHAWAADDAKLDRYMDAVRETLEEGRSGYQYDGPASTAAWRSLGGKGAPTLKALRALPAD